MSLPRELFEETTLYDRILFVALLLLSVSSFFLVGEIIPSGGTVTIEVDGRTAYRLSLHDDRVVEVRGPIGVTRVEISNSRVRVTESPGPRKLCIRQGWTERGVIICLPNRVVIRVGGEGWGGLDAISG